MNKRCAIIILFTTVLTTILFTFAACTHDTVSKTHNVERKNNLKIETSSQHYLYHIEGSEGLTNEDVVGIAQDKRGLLWIATEEGLNSYDGTSFRHFYRPEEPSTAGIADNELSDIIDDHSLPVLWIASERNGLTAYDYSRNTFKQYRHRKGDDNSLADNHITSLHQGRHGKLWITTYEKGLDCLDTHSGQITHFNATTVKGMPDNHIWTASDDGQGHLYVGDEFHGLTIIDLKHMTATRCEHHDGDPTSLPDNEVRSIHITHTGKVLLGTGKGLAVFSPHNRSFRTIPSSTGIQPNIYSIVENNGHILVATEQQGVMETDSTLHHLAPLQFSGPSPDDIAAMAHKSVRCLYADKSHNVWAGSWAGGLDLICSLPPLFRYLPYSTTQPSSSDLTWQSILCVTFDHQGNLWAGTDGAGINRFRRQIRTAVYDKASGSMNNNSVQAALCDSRGRLWWGIYQGGALCQDATTGAITHPLGEEGKKVDVRTFLEDPRYGMLIGTETGLYASGKLHNSIGNNKIRALCVDRTGILWVGLYDGGVVKCSRQLRPIANYTADNGELPNNTVNALLTDRKGNVWVGTNDGLVCFSSSGKKKVYQRSDGLSNTHIRSIIEDRQGRIWMGTNRGISCICLDKVYNFGKHENIRSGYFMDRAAAMAPDGSIFMGSIDGLCKFNPDIVMRSPTLPSLHINGIWVLGKEDSEKRCLSYTDLSVVRLRHDENNLQIGFNIDNLALTSHFSYAYRVKGLDRSWHILSTPGTIILRNVPSGHYTLEIRLSSNKRGNNNTISATPFYIAPPFYRSWIAYLLYIGLAIAAALTALHLYKQRLKERSRQHIEHIQQQKEKELNEERLRFFTNVAHELRTPLTLIIGPLDDLREELINDMPVTPQKHKNESTSSKDFPKTLSIDTPSLLRRLNTIHSSVCRLLGLVNQLLEVRKIETNNRKLAVAPENIRKLVTSITARFIELNTNKELHYIVDCDDTTLLIDNNIMQTILDNLLSNAIKYTPRGFITVKARKQQKDGRSWMAVSVADTGYGIAADALPHIFDRYYQAGGWHQASGTGIGLALAFSLAQLHHGELTVESTVGKGSTFTFWLPAEDIYTDNERKKGNTIQATDILSIRNRNTNEVTPISPVPQSSHPSPTTDAPIVLVVEDNTDIRQYIAETLSHEYQVLEAANGEEGLQEAVTHLPDIIISDIMMPVMDGIALCKKVKNDVRTSHIPVILLTAKDSIADKEEGYDSGADSYLTKPFSARLIRSRVANLLEIRKRLAALIVQQMTRHADQTTDETSQQESEPAITAKASSDTTSSNVTDSLSPLDAAFLQKLYAEIDANISNESLGIPLLCNHLNMSTSTLYRKIKSLTGISGNSLIRTRRLHHAAILLSKGATVNEAAYASGFGDLSYFRTCFIHQYGMTPSDYGNDNNAQGDTIIQRHTDCPQQ